MTQIIGIDPGISGAVGIITEGGRYVDVFDMPTVLANKTGNRQMVSPIDLAKLLRNALVNAPAGIVAVTEGVHAMPEQGWPACSRSANPTAYCWACWQRSESAPTS